MFLNYFFWTKSLSQSVNQEQLEPLNFLNEKNVGLKGTSAGVECTCYLNNIDLKVYIQDENFEDTGIYAELGFKIFKDSKTDYAYINTKYSL